MILCFAFGSFWYFLVKKKQEKSTKKAGIGGELMTGRTVGCNATGFTI